MEGLKIYVNSKKELLDIYDTCSATALFNNQMMRNGKMKVFITNGKNGKALYYECANGEDGAPCIKCKNVCNSRFKGARKYRIGKFFEFLEKHKHNVDSDDE